MTSDKMPAPPSRAVKLCGTEEIDPPSRRLGSGPLSVELENGQLRYVRYAGIEVLRGIAFLVRDENWGTYSPQIENLDIQERAEGFAVAYRAVCSDARQRLAFEARITGSSDGRSSSARSPCPRPTRDQPGRFCGAASGRPRRRGAESDPCRRERGCDSLPRSDQPLPAGFRNPGSRA